MGLEVTEVARPEVKVILIIAFIMSLVLRKQIREFVLNGDT